MSKVRKIKMPKTKVNLGIIESYDEEVDELFVMRVEKELLKVLRRHKVNLCNDEVQISVELLKENV